MVKPVVLGAGLALLFIGCDRGESGPAFSPGPDSFSEAQVRVEGLDEERTIASVDSTFFGINPPFLGRVFVSEEYGGSPVAILSHAFWVEQFEERPEIIGSHLEVDREERTIVGVMPPGVDVPTGVAVWIPGEGNGGRAEGADDEQVVPGEMATLHLADGSSIRGVAVMVRKADGFTTPAVFLGPPALAGVFTDGTFEFSADALPSRVRRPGVGERLVREGR